MQLRLEVAITFTVFGLQKWIDMSGNLHTPLYSSYTYRLLSNILDVKLQMEIYKHSHYTC